MAEISVIVPIYNSEKYIKRCIDSILTQTFTDFELILVDDGSTDLSGKICDDYKKQDLRIQVNHQINLGQAAARNSGIKQASANWIAFVDADDVIHPQYLEILYRAVAENKVKISACHAFEGEVLPKNFFDKQLYSGTRYPVNEQNLGKWYFGTDEQVSKFVYWVVWGKLIHKDIIQKHPFTSHRIYEDNAVAFKWLYEAGDIVFCNNTAYFYYINPAGTTKRDYTLKRLDWLWAVQEQIHFYEKARYHKLVNILKKQYIWEALREYKHIITLLRDKHAAGKLRRHIILYGIKNRGKLSISYSERMEILSRLYPSMMKLALMIKRKFKS